MDLRSESTENLISQWADSTLIVTEDSTQDILALRLSRQYREEGHRVEIACQYQSVAEALSRADLKIWNNILFISASGEWELHETDKPST